MYSPGVIVYIPTQDEYGVILRVVEKTSIGYKYDIMLSDRTIVTEYDFMIETI